MRKISMFIFAFVIPGLVLAADPSNAKPEICSTESPSIEKIGHDAFMNAPGLTDAQKIKLSEIMKATFGEAQKIKLEIANQKVDLFEVITNPAAQDSEVTKIKRKIVELDKKRLDLMFKSLDAVQKVVGKNPETGKYLRSIMKEKMQVDDRKK